MTNDGLDELIDACVGSVACDGSTAGACAQSLKTAVRAALASSPVSERHEAEAIILKHRRHVESSPGVGERAQRYGLLVCEDILADLQRASSVSVAAAPVRSAAIAATCAAHGPFDSRCENCPHCLQERSLKRLASLPSGAHTQDLLDVLKDAAEIRSACGFMWMRMAVAADAQDAFDVGKREFQEHEPAFRRLETSLPKAIATLSGSSPSAAQDETA